jgi:hypothetical protein
VDLGGRYDIAAQNNLGGVTGTAIEDRIYDQLHNATLGRILS